MNEWIEDLADIASAGRRAVLVTVASVRGSAPREPGAKMIVTADETIGTIGGGQLEYQSARIAVGMLDGAPRTELRRFPLGSSMGQCCGGVAGILFEALPGSMPGWLADLKALHGERAPAVLVTQMSGGGAKLVVTRDDVYGNAAGLVDRDGIAVARRCIDSRRPESVGELFLEPVLASDFHIAVFGAGHVGAALVDTLSRIDCNVRWVDSRRDVFRQVPRNVRAVETEDAGLEVAAMPAGSHYLVMTHSHALDYDICGRVLRRGDAAYLGLIGSRSKRRRFEKRFLADGLSRELLATLTCPIGIDGVTGKKPAEIAIATAAQLLAERGRRLSATAGLPAGNVRPI